MRLWLAVVIWFLSLAVVAPLPWAAAQIPGGWSEVSVESEAVVNASEFAVKARQNYTKAAGLDEKVTLVKILSAQQQVVAGVNYRLRLRVKAGDSLKTAEAVVWVRLWLKEEEQYRLVSWEFVDEK